MVCHSGYYFDKKRALATGISVCGSGAGIMFLLLEKYMLEVSLACKKTIHIWHGEQDVIFLLSMEEIESKV